MKKITLDTHLKAYFASDHHLGAPNVESSLVREKKFLNWLNHIEKDAGVLFIMGDFFDFWFEYKKVVPKGFVRVLGKLASMADAGLPIYFFTGNHDLWMNDYFEKELGIRVFHQPQEFQINQTLMYLAHGDGLGPGDKSYKLMKKVFTNSFSKWLFRWVHPDIGVSVAQYFSVKNKLISGEEDVQFLGKDKELLIRYAQKLESEKHRDYYLFGHRHLPMVFPLEHSTAMYVNTGDWVSYFTFVSLDAEGNLKLLDFSENT